MTPKEKLEVHVQIERENARKQREWQERRELNERIAEEAMRQMEEMGVIA